jgi:hypothetical protein
VKPATADAERERGVVTSSHRTPWAVIAVAAVVVALAAWRATMGFTFMDDGYYAAATVRLAQGARLFADEMFLQSLGFLAVLPFAKVWAFLFGTTGIVVALRLVYVGLATAAAVALYRLLRPSFGPWACLLAAAAPFLAPVYNLFWATYDSMALLGLLLACVLAFAAVRDSRRSLAVWAGVFAAYAAISYPPLAIAAFVLLATLAVRSKDKRLAGSMALGAVPVVAVFAVWLLSTVSVAELRIAVDFALGARTGGSPAVPAGMRLPVGINNFLLTMRLPWLGIPVAAWFLPLLGLSAWLAWAGRRDFAHRGRGLALVLLPLGLILPVIANRFAIGHGAFTPATLGSNILITFALFAAPSMVMGLRHSKSAVHELALMAMPASLVAAALVMYLTSADVFWGSGLVGLAPLAVAALLWWTGELQECWGEARMAIGALLALAGILVLLFSYSFKDDVVPLAMGSRIAEGPYAGIVTTPPHASQLAALRSLSARWLPAGSTVTVVSVPGLYLAVGGDPLTNVTWLDPGPRDSFTVSYLERRGGWPNVVLVPLAYLGQKAAVLDADPFVSAVLQRYSLAERSTASGMAVFVLKAPATAP